MRLTLRTLLAYMDDILAPAQAREIGQKLKDSEMGRQLLERIREVVRRRRITAPDPDGANGGLDPNTVAEYLDNNLAPDGVADVERVCLESDVHLAEVAACHQILTLVLGDPVEVPERTRERMYALGPVRRKPDAEPHPAHAAAAAAPTTRPASGDGFESRIPEYLRRKPMWRRVLPFALVGGVVAVWLALILFDPSLNVFDREPDADGVGGPVAPAGGDAADDADEAELAATDEAGNNAEAGETEGADDAAPGVPVASVERGNAPDRLPPDEEGINPPPPENEPGAGAEEDPPVAVAPVPERGAKPDDPPALVEREPMPEEKPGEPARPADADAAEEPAAEGERNAAAAGVPRTQYVSKSGVLLRKGPAEEADESDEPDDEAAVEEVPVRDEWVVVPEGTTITEPTTLACPVPFEATLEMVDGVRVRMLGGTRISLQPPAEGASYAVDLDEGRLDLERLPAPDAPEEAVVAVSLGDRKFAIVLGEPGTACAIDVSPIRTTGYEEPVQEESYDASLYLISGTVQVVSLDRSPQPGEDPEVGRSVPLSVPKSRLSLRASDWPLDGGEAQSLPQPIVLAGLPEWLWDERSALSAVYRRPRLHFERQFEVAETVAESIEPATKDPDATISEFATRTLGLVRDVRGLVNALATSPHPESRTAAVDGLRTWIAGRDVAEVTPVLRRELSRYFNEDVADTVYRLLWGYDAEDGRDRQTSRQLVDWLGHDEEAVRHLAFYHVRRLTGRDYEYQPHESSIRRMASIRRWRQHLEDTGALIEANE